MQGNATFALDRYSIANSSYAGDLTSGADITTLNNFPFGNSERTISLWFQNNTPYPGGNRQLFSYGDNNSGGRFGLYMDGTSIGVEHVGGARRCAYTPDGIWHNFTVTYPASGMGTNDIMLYFDGVLQTSSNLNPVSSLNTANSYIHWIGTLGFSPGWLYAFSGKIDDIGIWNRALTQQEITALYNAQTCNSSSNTITADGPTTFCAGNSVNLKSDVVGGTYQWKKNGVNVSSNGTSRTYKATATGSYTCVATCNGTALTSNAIQVTSKTNAGITVTATGATSFCVGDSVTLNCTNLGSNYSVQWYRTNISMENATNYTQVVKQPGTYKVVSKNLTTGCSRISSSSVVVAVNCRLTNPDVIAVENDLNDESARTLREDMPETIRIYPNPNDGSFTFEFQTETEGAGDLQIINMMGQSIYNANVTATNGTVQHQINLGDPFEKGLYIVRYTLNGEQYDRKLMLK
jgi:hypothetical protein